MLSKLINEYNHDKGVKKKITYLAQHHLMLSREMTDDNDDDSEK